MLQYVLFLSEMLKMGYYRNLPEGGNFIER